MTYEIKNPISDLFAIVGTVVFLYILYFFVLLL